MQVKGASAPAASFERIRCGFRWPRVARAGARDESPRAPNR